jgi:uncharacterized protein (DUF1778 family)
MYIDRTMKDSTLKQININFHVDEELKELLDEQAALEERSLSNFIRYVLKDYLRHQQSEKTRTAKKR